MYLIMVNLLPTLIVLSWASSITANEEFVCESDWHKHNIKCYWFSDQTKTREESKLDCESRNASLVTINNEQIGMFLRQQASSSLSYWIGLRMNNISPTAWRWNTGGTLSSSLYWCADTTSPTTACAVIPYSSDPCISSRQCNLVRPFFCDKEKMVDLSCPTNWTSDGNHTRCYYKSTQKMTRMKAARYCFDNGGRLVVVSTDTTKQYLTDNRHFTDHIHWIGLSPYMWDDGSPYNWNNWDINGPSIGSRCARLLPDATWKYDDCSMATHNFICQKDAISFTQTTRPSTTTTTTQTTQPSTASSITTTQANIEDTTTSASTSGPTTSTYSISATTSIPTRTVSTSSITRLAGISTTYTIETMTITQNVNTMSTHAAPDSTTINDTENTALGNSETTTTLYNKKDRSIILYVLIGIYTAVGVTAIVFIGLLAKYISLRRRYEKLNDKTPNETDIDDIDFDDNNDHKLYENQEYISDDPHESITSGKATVPQNVETDNIVYSDIDVDSRKPKDGNDIETKQTSGDTVTHQVNQVPVKQISHTLSNGEHDVVKADDEHSEQGENSHLYYNDPDCMASLTNSEQVNIYDDPINVTISESDDRDT